MIGFDALLREATARGDVPCAVGTVLTRDGPVWSGAFGVRDTTTGAPATSDTVFWIASMTKPLTSIVALQLVDKGLLSLDAPVGDVLPALANPLVLEGVGEAPTLRPARSAPTLRHLLTHTSGYAYPRWDAALLQALRQLGLPSLPRTWDELARTPLVFDPGARWTYGIGIDVVGKMIEAVTGGTLAEAVEAGICRPLGMADTRFVLTEDQRARAAPIHVRDGGVRDSGVQDGGVRDGGRWVPSGPVAGRQLGFMAGGGGMFSTVPDYARLLGELLAGAPRLLSAPGWAAMTGNQIGDLQVQVLRSAEPGQSVDVDFGGGQGGKWSLGFMLNPQALHGRRGANSQFWSGLANTYFWLDRPNGIAGALMMSVLPFGYPAALELWEDFERAAYAQWG